MRLNTVNARQGMLLMGRPGLNMYEDAISFAKDYLRIDNLDLHPDYLYVCPPKGKKTIGVEEAVQVVTKGSLRPAICEKQIIIIDKIDTMTVSAQNKILKLLEDCESVIVIGIAYSDNVLDTIKSRMSVYEYSPLDEATFLKKCSLDASLDGFSHKMYYYLTGGCLGLIPDMLPFNNMFNDIVNAISSGNLPELLNAMHLVKEKDRDAITNTPFIKAVIHLMSACFANEILSIVSGDMSLSEDVYYNIQRLEKILLLLAEHEKRCDSISYTKDNFFFLVVSIIEL